MRKVTAAILSAFMALPPAGSAAQTSIPWTEVGGWIVAADSSLGFGCFVLNVYEDGTAIRLGFDKSVGGGYVLLGNTRWASIEELKDYDITIQMDNEPIWTAIATGGRMDDLPVLRITFGDPDFVYEFMRKLGLRVWFNGREVANLSLRGSAAAAVAMLECQEAFNEMAPSVSDPFSDGPSQPTQPQPGPPASGDPFA
jgi:hypothetical protein